MYITAQDMIDRYGEEELIQLTDRTDSGGIDDAVLAQALADAAAEIDGYLATRYQLPLAGLPPSLVRVASEIARYILYKDRPTETVSERYDNAVRFLKAVARGEVTLVQQTGNAAPPDSDAAQVSAPDKIFTSASLENF